MKKLLALGLGVCLFTSTAFGFNSFKAVSGINKFTNSLEKSFKEDMSKISNAELKKNYTKQFGEIKDAVKQNTTYITRYNSDYYVEDIVDELLKYKSLNKEINYVLSTNQNPYSLSTGDTTAVESGILTIQKDVISQIENGLLKMVLSTSGVVTSGNMEISTLVDDVLVNISLKEIQEKTNFKAMSKESSVKLAVDVDLSKKGMEKYSVYVDLNVKVLKDVFYITLNDLSLSGDSKNLYKTQFDTVKSIIKGKTVKLDLKEIYSKYYSYMGYYSNPFESMNSFAMINKIYGVLAILKTDSLLTPYKKINNDYYLVYNTGTLMKIGEIFDATGSEMIYQIGSMNDEMKESGLYYNGTDASGLYIDIEKYDHIGKVSFTDTNGDVKLLVDVKGRLTHPENYVYLLLKKDTAVLQITDKGSYSSTFINGVWKDNNLSVKFESVNYYDSKDEFTLSGVLSDKVVDLTAVYNGKEIGTIKVSQDSNKASFDVNFKVLEQYFNFDFKMKGNVEYEYKDVDVVAPTDYVDAGKLLESLGMYGPMLDY